MSLNYYSDGDIRIDFPGAGGNYKSIQLPDANGNMLLDTTEDWEQGSFSVTWTGANTSSETWRFSRKGNMVCMMAPALNSTGFTAASMTCSGVVPSNLRPISFNVNAPVGVRDAGIIQGATGLIIIDTGGNLTIFKTWASGGFLGLGNTGHNEICFSYLVI